MSRLFAIGDIHGCDIALAALIEWISPTKDDIVVTLGDYVDRGPNSRAVIDRLIALGNQTQLVGIFGNHEEMMVDVIGGRMSHHTWLRYGGVDTLESYNFDGDMEFLPLDHQNFLAGLGDFFETDSFFFTHGNYDSNVPLTQQAPEMLRWSSLRDHVPAPHISGKTAVVGHTAQDDGEIFDIGHLVCIDTYCYGGGYLTAMEMNSGEVFQVDAKGNRR